MSHRAAVAYEVDNGVFDVHYSHNGAQDLQLEPILREQFEMGETKPGVDDTLSKVPQMEKWGSLDEIEGSTRVETRGSDAAVEREPAARGVPLRGIGLGIEMDDFEALYLVRKGRVETYIPVWAYPNVIRPWRNQLRAEVYKGGRIPDDPRQMFDELQETEPLRVIDDELLSGNFLDDTITTRIVRDHHQDVYPIVRRMKEERSDITQEDSGMEASASLLTESHRLLIKPQSGNFDTLDLPPAVGQGLFIEAGSGPQSKRPTELDAAEIRFDIGGRLNAVSSEPTEEDIIEAQADLLIEMHKEFGDRIATFSPPPHGQIIEALQSIDNVESAATSKLASILKQN